MTDEHTAPAPGYFLRMLREQALLIIAVAVLFAAAGYAYSASQKKTWEARASLLVQDPATALTSAPSTALGPAQLASAESARVTRQAVVARVKDALRTTLTTGQLAGAVTTFVDPSSNLVLVTASADDPTLAANIANAFAEQDAIGSVTQTRAAFSAQAAAMRSQLSKLAGNGPNVALARVDLFQRMGNLQTLANAATPVEVEARATTPSSPSSPKTVRNTAVLGLLGLLIGIGLADLRRARDRRIRDPREIEDELGFPLIGHISSHALGHGGQSSQGNGQGELSPADLEGFRILRQNLQFLDVDSGICSIVVTSALAEEGKSTVAALLAHASVAAGKTTLLIDCDLRRPVLAKRLGLASEPGLSDYLKDVAQPSEILQAVEGNPIVELQRSSREDPIQPNAQLVCITAGSQPRPAELLTSEKFRALITQVTTAYDAVIIDTGPVLPVVDTLELAPLVDGIIVCVRAGKTTHEQAAAAMGALERIPKRPTGIVVTGVTPRTDPYYTYYQTYTSET